MNTLKTGLVIVNYNDFETTKKFIDTINNFKSIDRIVVVDNKSTDNSLLKFKKLKLKKLDVLENTSNKGYASGVNLGSKHLIELYESCNIIVSNSDIVIDNNEIIDEIIYELNNDNHVAIAAPMIKQHSGYDKGWKTPRPWQDVLLNIAWIHRFLRPKLLGYDEKLYKNKIVEVDQVSGCFFAIKSKVLEKIKFLDEGTFLYYEESILSSKLKKSNLKTIVITDLKIFHNHSVSIDKSINRIKKYKILKQSQMYFHKNYNDANILDIIMLWITNKITLLLLYIVSLFK